MTRMTDAVAGFETALLVVTEGDLARNEHPGSNAPCDSAIFALGFLLGALGRDRVLLVTVEDLRTYLPLDPAEAQIITFAVPEDGDLPAATDAVYTQIKRVIDGVHG